MVPFRLERVRRLREQLRRQGERAVGETTHAIAVNEAEVEALRAAQAEDWNAAVGQLVAGMTAGELQSHARYGVRLTTQEAAAVVTGTRLQSELAARRARLVLARMEERKVEQLRTRWQTRQAETTQRAADRLQDELALRRHGAGR